MLGNGVNTAASVKVIGIGGAGGNAVAAMQKKSTSGTEYIVMNTDEVSLKASPCRKKLLLSQRDAMENRDAITRHLEGGSLVILVAGLGGNAGTNATPVVARIAKEMGILVLCLVTLPMRLEGEKRLETAKAGAKNLKDIADCVAVLHTEQLVANASGYTTLNQVFDKVSDTLQKVAEGTAAIVYDMEAGLTIDAVRDRLRDNGYIFKGKDSLWKIGTVSKMLEIKTSRRASEMEVGMMKNSVKERAAAYTHGELLYIVQQDSASGDYIITGITERAVAERNGVRHLTAICVLFVTSGPHRGKWLCHDRAPKQWAKGKQDCKAPSWNFWGGHITASLEQLDVIGQKVSREICDPGMAIELSEELYCRGTGVSLEEWRSPHGPSGTIAAAPYHHDLLIPIGLTSLSQKDNCEVSYLYALPISGEDADSLIAADDYIRDGEKHNIALSIKPMSEDELRELYKNAPAVEVCDAVTRLWLTENASVHDELSKSIADYLQSHV